MVLQRKTEEAAMATKRLKELLEARKSSPREHSAGTNGFGTNGQTNEKSLQRWLDHELEVMVNVHEVRHEYEKQSHVRAALAEELAVLRQVDEFAVKGLSPPRGKNGFARYFFMNSHRFLSFPWSLSTSFCFRASSLSPNARMARISSLENMLVISSNSLVAMASQLSEAEERERAFTNRGRWNQLRSMGEAKNLLQYMFNSLAETRCQLWEKDVEIKEMKDQFKEIVGLLRQSELRRKEAEKELKLREQAIATSLGTPPSSVKHVAEDLSTPSPMTVPAQKQLKFTPGIANGKVRGPAAFLDTNKKMVPMGQVSMRKLSAVGKQGGRLWRWKRSHHQWIVQFKWKWQKPWRLSEWIRTSDETLLKSKPRLKALPNKIM
jgi:kinesin family protein 4/21/27